VELVRGNVVELFYGHGVRVRDHLLPGRLKHLVRSQSLKLDVNQFLPALITRPSVQQAICSIHSVNRFLTPALDVGSHRPCL
jgi:hypothetical protein